MSAEQKQDIVSKIFQSKKTLIPAVVVLLLGGYIGTVVCGFQGKSDAHASLAELSAEDSLVMEGQLIYAQEGCQYCHSQSLRPISWEVTRFADAEKLGLYAPMDYNETRTVSPSLRGSFRVGPDLARLSSKMEKSSIESFLKGSDDGTQRGSLHQYGYLFEDEDMSPLFLSWRIRMMLNAGAQFSDPYQRSVFLRLDGQTKGDALVAYLSSLGKKQMMFNGKFYADR